MKYKPFMYQCVLVAISLIYIVGFSVAAIFVTDCIANHVGYIAAASYLVSTLVVGVLLNRLRPVADFESPLCCVLCFPPIMVFWPVCLVAVLGIIVTVKITLFMLDVCNMTVSIFKK